MTAIRILANLSTTTCFFSAPSDRDFLNRENTFDWFIYLERRKIQIGKGTDERLFVCGNSCQWPESLNFPLKVVIEDNLASGLDKLSHPDAQNLCGDSIYCQVFTCCQALVPNPQSRGLGLTLKSYGPPPPPPDNF